MAHSFAGWTPQDTGFTCQLCKTPIVRWTPGPVPSALNTDGESFLEDIDAELKLPQADDGRLTERLPLPCSCDDPTVSAYLDQNQNSTVAADAARRYSLVWKKRYELLCSRLEAVPATRYQDAARTRLLPDKWAPHVSPATGQLISMRYQLQKQIGHEFHTRMHPARNALSGLKSKWKLLREKRAEERPDKKLIQRLETAMAELAAKIKSVRDDPETEELREVLVAVGQQYVALPEYQNLLRFLQNNPLEPGRRKLEEFSRKAQAMQDDLMRRIEQCNRRLDSMGKSTFGDVFGFGDAGWFPANEQVQEAFQGALFEGAQGAFDASAAGQLFEAGKTAVDGVVESAQDRLAGAFSPVLGDELAGRVAGKVAEKMQEKAQERLEGVAEGVQEELLEKLGQAPEEVGAAGMLQLGEALAQDSKVLRSYDHRRVLGGVAALRPVALSLHLPPELENGAPPSAPAASSSSARGGRRPGSGREGVLGALRRNLKL